MNTSNPEQGFIFEGNGKKISFRLFDKVTNDKNNQNNSLFSLFRPLFLSLSLSFKILLILAFEALH